MSPCEQGRKLTLPAFTIQSQSDPQYFLGLLQMPQFDKQLSKFVSEERLPACFQRCFVVINGLKTVRQVSKHMNVRWSNENT